MDSHKPKLGSEDYPILLVPHTSDTKSEDKTNKYSSKSFKAKKHEKRNTALLWPRKNFELTTFERSLDAIKNSTDYYEAFILNIIKNPHLSALEVKLALYFYRKELDDLGEHHYGICYLIEHYQSTSSLKNLIGESGWLNYQTDEMHFEDIKKDIVDLREELPKLNIHNNISNVKTAIYNLQDWGYITITPISWNYVHKRSARSVMPVDKDELNREYAVNIRIFPLYTEKCIFKTVPKE